MQDVGQHELILVPLALGKAQAIRKKLGGVQLVPSDGIVDFLVFQREIPRPHAVLVEYFILKDREVRRGPPFAAVIGVDEVEDDQLRAGALLLGHSAANGIRLQKVVAVHKDDVPPAGGLDAGVARSGKPTVLAVDDPHAAVAFRPGIAHFGAAVGAAVVDEQHLNILEGLIQHALHAGVKIPLDLVHRDNDTDRRDRGERGRGSPLGRGGRGLGAAAPLRRKAR